MKKTKSAVKPKVSPYQATIRVLGKDYEAKGETISEAISKLTPQNCKGKGILTITKGKVTKDRILMPHLAFRLFNSHGLSQEMALKQVSSLFDGI